MGAERSSWPVEKTEPSTEMSTKSLRLAKAWLKRAKDGNILGYRDLAILASHISMLHAARAILFKDGVKAKDDHGMLEYIKKRYPQLREHMVSLDQYGRLVSAIQRDPDVTIGGKDAKGAMSSANDLMKLVEGTLSKQSNQL